ncbi:unnamed protein product [Rhizophagus irregularis]|uniref:Uncharacterized protein n=1 Tax=Rhizophagus irregularis TaxID=588596 RepID=A0A916EAS7_9GLOM|nr:unnamed protein product [Rhizophagus irregularis]CAB5373261.1 unnamed protein product [Rhizophagus irregularis]
MALSVSARASIPVYRQYIILRPYGSALWPMLGLECCGIYIVIIWNLIIIRIPMSNKKSRMRLQERSRGLWIHLLKDIVEFFAELDKEFEAKLNQRNLERSFDKNSSELLKKSGDLNTLRLSSYYIERSAEERINF